MEVNRLRSEFYKSHGDHERISGAIVGGGTPPSGQRLLRTFIYAEHSYQTSTLLCPLYLSLSP